MITKTQIQSNMKSALGFKQGLTRIVYCRSLTRYQFYILILIWEFLEIGFVPDPRDLTVGVLDPKP